MLAPLSLLKWLALALVLIVIAAAALFFTLRESHAPTMQKIGGKSAIEQPVIVENDGGTQKWKLRAERAEQGLHTTHLFQATLELYDQQGVVIPIHGDEAWFDPIKRSARFVGHVTIDYQSWHVQSSQALFDSTAERVYLPKAFTAQGPEMEATGEDLVIDKRQQRLLVRKHVWINDLRNTSRNKR